MIESASKVKCNNLLRSNVTSPYPSLRRFGLNTTVYINVPLKVQCEGRSETRVESALKHPPIASVRSKTFIFHLVGAEKKTILLGEQSTIIQYLK